jgi:hypothetical protein
MNSASRPERLLRMGREGMALPMALMALIIVTLLVLGTMTTGSTESAIGMAHQNASHALYEADAALEWYLGSRAMERKDVEPGVFERDLPSGSRARFSAALLSDPSAAQGLPRLWHVTAEPLRQGGRAVGTLVHTLELATRPQAPTIGGAITLGMTVHAHPNSGNNSPKLFGRPTAGFCADTIPRPIIIHASADSVENHGGPTPPWAGETIVRDTRAQAALATEVTQGTTLAKLAGVADFQFGPVFGEPSWRGSASAWNAPVGENPRNWGCPAGFGLDCQSVTGATSLWPIVALDGNGGNVDLVDGIHGQGVLIVVNGNLHVHPPFHWRGVILVDGAVNLHGGSGGGFKNEIRIEGAVVALGNSVGGRRVKSRLVGQSLVRYNSCAIKSSQRQIEIKAARLEEGDVLMYTPYARTELTR